MMLGGLQIYVDLNCIKKGPRLFPESKNRSRRVTKKLIRRHGGTHKMEPCILQMGDKVIMHPILYETLWRRIQND